MSESLNLTYDSANEAKYALTAEHTRTGANKTLPLLKEYRIECFLLGLYVVLLILVSIFHEPWYDEAQAWMIARSASVKDILFSIPHYEGHPPLWHLILLPFARLGAPFEFTLSAISIILGTAAMALVLFKSSLPRFLRRVLPFTYFFFYQYGVISRPYSLLILAFMLVAVTYRLRDAHPWRFAASLGLLCLASSYGIIFAGGICLVWLWEIWDRRPIGAFLREFLRDRRFYALLALLALAVLLIILIFPASDANGVNLQDTGQGFFARLFFMLLLAPADGLFYSSMDYGALFWQSFAVSDILIGGACGILLLLVLYWIGEKAHTRALLFVPYLLYAVFSASVYFWIHHLGIFTVFLVFWLSVSFDRPKSPEELSPAGGFTHFIVYALTMFSCCMSLFWNVCASVADIQNHYGHGRSIAEFIKDYQLTEYPMMVSWEHDVDEKTGKVTFDLANCPLAVSILPYLKDNPFINLSDGSENYYYARNRAPRESINDAIASYVRTQPLPRVLIGDCFLTDIYQKNECSGISYIPVYVTDDNYIWKNIIYDNHYYVFMDETLAKELGLSAIPVPEWNND